MTDGQPSHPDTDWLHRHLFLLITILKSNEKTFGLKITNRAFDAPENSIYATEKKSRPTVNLYPV
ncbi:MAG: hypothetical protein ACFE89_12910 [Candidatus Hodarchaeota archaeon]